MKKKRVGKRMIEDRRTKAIRIGERSVIARSNTDAEIFRVFNLSQKPIESTRR